MTELFWSRWRRWWVSASAVLAAGLSAAGLIGLVKDVNSWMTQGTGKPEFSWSAWVGLALLVAGMFIFLRSYAEYRQRTYDPKWIGDFSKQFDEPLMVKARALASTTLLSKQGELKRLDKELENIEDVLDFFDQLGFYVYGDQI